MRQWSRLDTTVLMFVACDHRFLCQDITSNRARYPKPVYYYLLLATFGYNIVVSEGELWKKYRKISAPAFSEVSWFINLPLHYGTQTHPCQRNTKLVWDETIQTLTELFEQVWGDQDVVTLDHCLDMTFPVRTTTEPCLPTNLPALACSQRSQRCRSVTVNCLKCKLTIVNRIIQVLVADFYGPTKVLSHRVTKWLSIRPYMSFWLILHINSSCPVGLWV